jgi:hypothetical protein
MYINDSPVINTTSITGETLSISPNSYRAKTLTSVMGKVYEKVVLSRITKMLNKVVLVVFDIHVYQCFTIYSCSA